MKYWDMITNGTSHYLWQIHSQSPLFPCGFNKCMSLEGRVTYPEYFHVIPAPQHTERVGESILLCSDLLLITQNCTCTAKAEKSCRNEIITENGITSVARQSHLSGYFWLVAPDTFWEVVRTFDLSCLKIHSAWMVSTIIGGRVTQNPSSW